MALLQSKKDKNAQLDALLDILSKVIPRLQQLHIPMDGAGRTNLLLIHYLLAYFDLPPVVLMDPNATSIIDAYRCKKILSAGINNYFRIVCEYSPLRHEHKESLIVGTVKGKKDKRYPENNLPEVLDYPADFQQQAMELTRTCLLEFDMLPAMSQGLWMDRAGRERLNDVRDNKSQPSAEAESA